MVPLNCGVCSFWVGLDRWLVKVAWLGALVSVFWWLELDLFSLECNEVSSSDSWGVCVLGIALGSLSFNFRFLLLFCWRISVMCLVLELVGFSVELGFSVGKETFE